MGNRINGRPGIKKAVEALCWECYSDESEDCRGTFCPLYGFRAANNIKNAVEWFKLPKRYWKEAKKAMVKGDSLPVPDEPTEQQRKAGKRLSEISKKKAPQKEG
jgi:hypothetical protein